MLRRAWRKLLFILRRWHVLRPARSDGDTIKQEFDSMGCVVRVVDSLGHASVTAFDSNGRKISETDASGRTTRYTYDETGRLLTVAGEPGFMAPV